MSKRKRRTLAMISFTILLCFCMIQIPSGLISAADTSYKTMGSISVGDRLEDGAVLPWPSVENGTVLNSYVYLYQDAWGATNTLFRSVRQEPNQSFVMPSFESLKNSFWVYKPHGETLSHWEVTGITAEVSEQAVTFFWHLKLIRKPISSTEIPGTQTPDTETPGTQTPDSELPDTETPGTQTPDSELPDTETPGTQTPNTETPGTQTPNTETPGTQTPNTGNSTSAGTQTPGNSNAGTQIPGNNHSGNETPSTETPGNSTSAETQTPGTETSGTQKPGPETSGNGSSSQTNTPVTIKKAGTYYLKSGTTYILEGPSGVNGDTSYYTDGIVFQVKISGNYTFR